MRRTAFALVAAVATGGFGQIASAADLPVKAPPKIIAPAFSWTGFYIGGNVGYGWADANDAMTLGGFWLLGPGNLSDNGVVTPFGNKQLRPSGFTGGIQAGYNYQAGQWVLGIETDANYFGLKDDSSRTFANPVTGSSFIFTSSFKSNWLVTVRPRIGYAFDRLLVYATGGLAVTNQKFSQNITQLNVAFIQAGSVSDTTVGWTVGAGVEYALGNQWSLKAEYLYVDPSISFSSTGVCPTDPTCSGYTGIHSAHLRSNIVRAGFNYKLY